MNTGFRRVIALILVISLLMTMTGCGTIDGRPASLLEIIFYVVTGVIQAVALVVGSLVLAAVFWVVDLIMSPIEQAVGGGDWWVVEDVAGPVVDGYGRLIDPTGKFIDWSRPEDEGSKQMSGSDHEPEETEPEAEETEQSDADGGDSGGLPQTGGEEEKSLGSKIVDWVSGLIGCDHTLFYNSDTLDIDCDCGVHFRLFDGEMTLEKFKPYVKKKFLQSQKKYDEYVLQEYCRYMACNSGVDPEVLSMALKLNIPDLDAKKLSKLQDVLSFLAETSDTVSTAADVCDGLRKGLGISTEFFEKINSYFTAANMVFVTVQMGAGAVEFQRLAEQPGTERELIKNVIKNMQAATSLIPVAGVAFDKALDTVEKGLMVVLDHHEIQVMQDYVEYIYLIENNATRDIWKIHNMSLWEEGPSLAELSELDLSAEELYALAPYIEFRLEYEMEEIFGTDISSALSK